MIYNKHTIHIIILQERETGFTLLLTIVRCYINCRYNDCSNIDEGSIIL